MALISIAREYVFGFGFSVIPVGVDKRPLVDWKEFQTRFPTEEELERWFSSDNVNIAIVTGPISGIVVLDIDGFEGEKSLKENALFLPPTPCVKTGRGFHYYFEYQDGVKNLVRRYPGIDLRGEGGYVLAPPSLHSSGVRYEWIIDLKQGFAKLPDWVFKREDKRVDKDAGWVEELLLGVEEGKRNDSLTRLAGHYFGKGLKFEETKIILLDWNRKNKPPLPEEELLKTVESIYKRESSKKRDEGIKLELLSDRERNQIGSMALTLIDRYLSMAKDITDAPEDYHLASILAILSTVVGPNVFSPLLTGLTRPLKCNLYVLLLGESSLYRKSTALYLALSTLKGIPECFGKPAEDQKEQTYGIVIPSSFSPEALLHILSKRDGKPSLLVKDEITGLFKAFKRQYMSGTKEDLIKIYDCDRIERMTLTNGYITIKSPYLTILSATTPNSFSQVFEDIDIQSGLLPRFLIAYPENHGKRKKIEFIANTEYKNAEMLSFQEEIKKIYDYWRLYSGIYYLNDQGLERFNELVDRVESAIDKDPSSDKVLARLPWFVYKIAMILQAVEDGLEGTKRGILYIKYEKLIYAIYIMDIFLSQIMKTLDRAGEGLTNNLIRRIMNYLNSGPKKKSEIMRKFHLTSRYTDEIKRTMIEREQIKVETGLKKGEVWRVF